MHLKSIIRASVTLLAEILLILMLTGCPNPTLLTGTPKGTGSITGIVVSETGTTIAGVTVTAEQTDGIKSLSTQRKMEGAPPAKSIVAQTMTDLNGSFTLSGLLPGIYTLNVSVPEAQAKAVTGVTVLEGQTVTTGTLQVRKTGDIAGKVMLSDNTDPLGIVVFIAGTSFSAMTDVEGNFRIIDVPTGTGYVLVASRVGYDSSITTVDVAVRSTTTVSPMTLTVHVPPATTGSLTGVVSLVDSADNEGIFVYLIGTSHICMTNTTGRFDLHGISPGLYSIKACKDGYVPSTVSVEIPAGVTAVAVAMTLEPSQPAGIEGPYFVTYDANGATTGTVPVDTNNYLQGFKVTVLSDTGKLKKGSSESFSGWNTAPDGSGTQYSPGDSFYLGSSDVILYATFQQCAYYVIYDGNGATGGEVPVDPRSPYAPYSIISLIYDINLVRTGYLFAGWTVYLPDGSSLLIPEGIPIMIRDFDVTLYATWVPE